MNAQYLIRFDDICPTMNWLIWEQVEEILLGCRVNPILAVVPANRDAHLRVGEPNPKFWERVRTWQERGWTIGLHGYQHLYVTADSGLVGINKRSEFSGLGCSEQRSKLQQALNVFENEGIKAALWVAPAHSFDTATVNALLELGIRYLSDGFSLYPHRGSDGMVWVPQQLWRFRKMPFGLWTVCLHLNHWSPKHVARFRSDLQKFVAAVTDWQSVISVYSNRKSNLGDSMFGLAYGLALKGRKLLRNSHH